ncbi:MAG: DNA alkylation repair protein [Saccharospirillaceae bacterium]|nr:hypothetical protein [Pseudomonadales bacterium]NRB80848.1 DNA alkylation repair protein [Saccharospirillaceae bacterium]
MAELLKDQYNLEFVQLLCKHLIKISSKAKKLSLNKDLVTLFMQQDWQDLELKQRMNRAALISLTLIEQNNFKQACLLINKLSDQFDVFLGMFIPPMITDLFFSLEDKSQKPALPTAFESLKHVTKNSTSEFAVRAFIEQYEKQTMAFMLTCCSDKSEHVRRFASEGSRPRLPWGQALTTFKKDPSLIWPILNELKQDSSLYVRRSVANNLNDISKDNPQLMLDWCEHNNKISEKEDWIIKHACRVLLKQAHPRALKLFDYSDPSDITVDRFEINQTELKIGEKLSFSCLLSSKKKLGKIRVEYCIDYIKANGKHNQKVFNWSEKTINKKTLKLTSTQSMAQMSTRKHYTGLHFISVRVNGLMFQKCQFELK